jgi:hypothetical protein
LFVSVLQVISSTLIDVPFDSGTLALACVHGEAIKVLIKENASVIRAENMMTDFGMLTTFGSSDILSDVSRLTTSEANDSPHATVVSNRSSIFLLYANPKGLEMTFHYNVTTGETSEQGVVLFSSLVTVSSRNAIKCSRHDTNCRCYNSINKIGVDDDEQFSDDFLDLGLERHDKPISYKGRPLNFNNKTHCRGHTNPLRNSPRNLPEEVRPTTTCTCVYGPQGETLKKCICRLVCNECGSQWSEECFQWGTMVVHSRNVPANVVVFARKCSQCCNILHYDGEEDGITVMTKKKDVNEFIAIETDLLVSIASDVTSCGATFSSCTKEVNQRYKFRGLDEYVVPKTTFMRGLWSCMQHLIVPFIDQKLCECEKCGPVPDVIVADGVAIGVRLQTLMRFFNELANQKGTITMSPTAQMIANSPTISEDTVGRLVVLTKSHNDVTVFTERLYQVGKQLAGFVGGKIKEKGAKTAVPFTMDKLITLRQALLDNKESSEACACVLPLVDNYWEKDRSCVQQAGHLKLPGLVGICNTLTSKSVAAIHGQPGGQIVFALLHLALGGSGNALMPKFSGALKSPQTVSELRAVSIAHRASQDVLPMESSQGAVIDNFFDKMTCIENPDNDADSLSARIANPILADLKKLLVSQVNVDSVQKTLQPDISLDSTLTVTDFLNKVLPAMAIHLRNECHDQTLSSKVRPIFAHLASKSYALWTTELTFVFEAEGLTGTFNRIIPAYLKLTLDSIATAAVDKPDSSPEYILLCEVIEGFQRCSTTPNEEANSAFFALPPQRMRLRRKYEYSNDSGSGSNADAATHGNMCRKEFPKSRYFTPGLFIVTCACSNKTVLICVFMDSGESPRILFNLILNRWEIAPRMIIYDNACHLAHYAMTRAWNHFFNTTFLIDRFHEGNHTTCCSRYKSTEHTRQEFQEEVVNTQACEQVNFIVRKQERTIRYLSLLHGVVFLNILFSLFNTTGSD